MSSPAARDRRRFVLLGGLFEAGLGATGLALGWLTGVAPLETLRPDLADVGRGLIATLPPVVLLMACTRWPVGPLGRIVRFSDAVIRPLFSGCSLAELGLLAVAAGVGEEILFRGFLQTALGSWFGPGLGMTLTCLAFGLLHPITPTYAVLAGLMGWYLAGLWAWSGNLLVPITVHAAYDFVALVWLLRRPDPGPNPPPGLARL